MMKRVYQIAALCVGVLGVAGCMQNSPDITMTGITMAERASPLDRGGFGRMAPRAVVSNQTQTLAELSRSFSRDLPAAVMFAPDATHLTPLAQAALAQQAQFMRNHPELMFQFYAHTDPNGASHLNRAVALARAENVRSYLIQSGVNADQLGHIIIVGESDPLNIAFLTAAENRRVVTEISGYNSAL